MSDHWNARLDALWRDIDHLDPDAFVAQMESLVAERAPDDAIGLFERASAHDSTGRPDLAVPLYRRALALWRGDAFATLDTPWLNAVRETLHRERLAADGITAGEVPWFAG